MLLKTELLPPHKVLQKTLINTTTRLAWMLAPGLTMHLITRLFFAPPQYKISENDKQTLSDAESFSLPVNGKRVTGWKWGEGPAVMLLHGWGGSGAQFVPFVEPLVAAGFSVVTYDNPAHRHSGGRTTSYFEFVETAKAVHNHIGNVEGVVAHSMGSGAAMNLARQTDETVKFVFISPLYNLLDVLMEYVDDSGIYKVPFNTIIENLEKTFNSRLSDISPSALAGKMRSEALIIHDENDRVTPINEGELLEKNWEKARLIKTSQLGHNRILKDSNVIEQTVSFMVR
jgi:pimeloyl-ACP methyl ester carboxylesterase